ncbi:phage holin family protein, partial [Pseudarthrobacter sp. NamE2]|uniref:phage holin family protein n=1 Tax=Pseudarthrobacter sp. NamE2 TaxID=2576838 RepID=UPI0010FD7B61
MPPGEAHQKADSTSLGDLLGEVTRDLSTLMRQELELAKAEAKQSATRAGKGGGMLAGAGVAGHFVLLFLSL